jgi:hypothetical protein
MMDEKVLIVSNNPVILENFEKDLWNSGAKDQFI